MRKIQFILRDLAKSTNGTITPIFGLCLVTVLIVSGIAVDSARGYRLSTEAGVALDAAALAAAKALRLEALDDAELEQLATDYFDANFNIETIGTVSEKRVHIGADRRTNTVTLRVDMKMPTTLAAVTGTKTLDVSKTATAVYDVRNVELSMMLDVSGSMSGSKLSDLKSSAGDLVNILLESNANGSDHKIAVAPFSTAVNAGVYADVIGSKFNARGRRYQGADTTCVTDRSGANAFSDADPLSGTFAMRSDSCPTSPVMPLSSDRDDIIDHIGDMQAGGMTAGHLGIAWAWYLLSPEWDRIWPSDSAPRAYNDPDYMKVAIIMSDGEFNTSYESANGGSEAQARELCDNMKAEGLSIYTVGFQAPAAALPILQYCATSPQHFFDARDGNQLRGTFRTIAKRLSGLRLAS